MECDKETQQLIDQLMRAVEEHVMSGDLPFKIVSSLKTLHDWAGEVKPSDTVTQEPSEEKGLHPSRNLTVDLHDEENMLVKQMIDNLTYEVTNTDKKCPSCWGHGGHGDEPCLACNNTGHMKEEAC